MEKAIREYLKTECGKSDAFINLCLEKMTANPDIMSAFGEWLATRDFQSIHSPVIEGYDAVKLNNVGVLSPVGVFNYLVYLRNKPTEAIAALENGLPNK